MDVEYRVDEDAGWMWLAKQMCIYELGWGTGWMKVLGGSGVTGWMKGYWANMGYQVDEGCWVDVGAWRMYGAGGRVLCGTDPFF